MDTGRFREGLDLLFEQNRISEVEPYLEGALRSAIGEEDDDAVVQVLNEMIGFYREMCDYDRAQLYGTRALDIISSAGGEGSLAYATTCINLANALRAAGRLDESLELYHKAEELYAVLLPGNSFEMASLYNNLSLVYQEASEFTGAIGYLNAAMDIVRRYPDRRFELAVTHTNLGNSLAGALKKDPSIRDTHPEIYEGIHDHLTSAIEIFGELNEEGAHLGAALMGMGELNEMLGDDAAAAAYYVRSMRVVDRNLGHIEYYYRARAGYERVRGRIEAYRSAGDISASPNEAMTGLELSRLYYMTAIRPMLEEKFPELHGHISAGLFGEGSDAFGYDDIESRDHDWGPGAVLLIDDGDLYEKYHQAVNDELILLAEKTGEFGGCRPDTDSIRIGRRGALSLSRFFDLPVRPDLSVAEYRLAAAVNGEVWDDPSGELGKRRTALSEYYPEDIRRMLLKQHCALFSQNARYNYLRMKRRNDNASADMLLAEGMKNAAHIAYILEKRYAPHDKWLFAGLNRIMDTGVASETGGYAAGTGNDPAGEDNTEDKYEYSPAGVAKRIGDIMMLSRRTPDADPTDASMRPVMEAIDDLSLYLQRRMITLGLISEPAVYMEDVIGQMDGEMTKSKEELVKRVVSDEWKAFDKVINEGGRADCQDNWGTFNIMRSSQYMTWSEEMLLRYATDFEAAMAAGWNPVTEKYGRMEESTAPDRYAQIADSLPEVSDAKRAIIEEIVSIQVGWMEEFAAEYPRMAQNARSIHTSEDTPFNTSYETYLRGELMTYGDEMLALYGSFIVDIAKTGRNLARMTMENTARLYGYVSLDDAEASL